MKRPQNHTIKALADVSAANCRDREQFWELFEKYGAISALTWLESRQGTRLEWIPQLRKLLLGIE